LAAFRAIPAHPAERYSSRILAVIGDLVLDLAGRDPLDVNCVADHVAGAALAFGASGHYLWPRFKLILNDLLKFIEQAFKLHHLRFYFRELGPRGLADQYLLSKQPSQLGFLPPEGVNDIDGGLCHFRPLGLLALLIGSCLPVSIPQKDIEDYPDDARFNSARVVSA
jgi:hypothetical protein